MIVTAILTFFIIGVCAFVLNINWKTKRLYTNYTLIPYRIPVLGHLLDFLKDANQFIFDNFAKYGSIFTANICGQHFTFLLDVHDLLTMTKNPSLVFSGSEMVTTIFGSHIQEDIAQVLHKTIYPQTLQRADALNALTVRFVESFHQSLEKDQMSSPEEWRQCGLFDLCHRFIFGASTRALFGDIEDEELKELETNFVTFNDKFYVFSRGLPVWFYKLFYRSAYQAREKGIKLLIKQRPNQSEFITAAREFYEGKHGDVFSPTDVGARMMIFFWASLGNTIPATFWILYYLLTTDKGRILEILREEILTHGENMNEMKVADSVINETLRLIGNVFLMRCTYKEDGTTLDLHDGRQLHIHPKDLVCYYPTISHYDKSVFPEPYKFQYDRFLHLNKLPGSYMPFGIGKSMCPGRFFVRNEVKTILITLVKEIELELVDFNYQQRPRFRKECVGTGVMVPDRDVKVRYRFKKQ
ncbi:unnamed protein product [Adineta ricciae]|uniref:Uncharacterized protein n=1 Tax=Adineta ricciae TaxID=249248 RepID=A0A814BED2_ADIRI|nr:unnamed protein product [Adineta ricciae]